MTRACISHKVFLPRVGGATPAPTAVTAKERGQMRQLQGEGEEEDAQRRRGGGTRDVRDKTIGAIGLRAATYDVSYDAYDGTYAARQHDADVKEHTAWRGGTRDVFAAVRPVTEGRRLRDVIDVSPGALAAPSMRYI